VPGLTITHRLGSGGSGTVWAAVRTDGTALAIKVVEYADHASAERAAREIAVLGRVGVEGLVGFHEALGLATDPPAVAIVLDRVAGGSLERAVRARGHLSVGESVTVLTPVARTLAGLHDAGVVHGDLSPANVLLERTGRPLVSDLGLARLVGERGGEVFCTHGFAAPEVVAGGTPTAASDVYALGALAWWCATGVVPGHALVRGRLEDLVPGLPNLWRTTTLRALAADPATRPSAAEAALAYFDSAAAEPLRLVVGTDETSLLTQRLRRAATSPADPDDGPGVSRAARRQGRSRARRRPSAAAVALISTGALVVVGGAATVTLGLGRGGTSRSGAVHGATPRELAADPSAPVDDPRGLMQELADLRAEALNHGDPVALTRLDAAASPALARDSADLAALATRGSRYAGVALHVRTARRVSVTDADATVEAVVDTAAYRVVGGNGARAMGARPGEPLRFRLVWAQGRWRIARIDAA
jgi:hypothetical protein